MNKRARQSLMRIYQAKVNYYNVMAEAYKAKLKELEEDDDGRRPQEEVQGGIRGGDALLERQHQGDASKPIREEQSRPHSHSLPFRRRGITKLD